METKELVESIQSATALMKEKAGQMAEETKKFGEATAESKASAEKASKRIDELELKLQKTTLVKPIGEPKDEKAAAQRAAFFKFVRHGKHSLEPQERKSLVEDTTGLLMVPEDLDTEIYRELPLINTIRQFANIRQTTRDRVGKRSLTEVTMSWGKLETGAQIVESTPVPSKDYIYVEDLNGLVKIGKDELMDSDDILAGIITDSFARARAVAESAAFVLGRGHTYGEPDGVTLDPTVIATQIDLATPDTIVPDDVINLEYALPAQYKNGAIFTWHPSTEAMLRKVKATANYLWVNPAGVQGAYPRTFDGYPVVNVADMVVPASTNTDLSIVALFGNWKAGYTIVDRMGMTVQRLDELYAESGMVGFLAHFRVGGGVVRPNAFRALDNNT